LNGLIMWYLC